MDIVPNADLLIKYVIPNTKSLFIFFKVSALIAEL